MSPGPQSQRPPYRSVGGEEREVLPFTWLFVFVFVTVGVGVGVRMC